MAIKNRKYGEIIALAVEIEQKGKKSIIRLVYDGVIAFTFEVEER